MSFNLYPFCYIAYLKHTKTYKGVSVMIQKSHWWCGGLKNSCVKYDVLGARGLTNTCLNSILVNISKTHRHIIDMTRKSVMHKFEWFYVILHMFACQWGCVVWSCLCAYTL